ncbi:hypothetical protein WDU94_012552 [Cyamophila willieti]
MRISLREFQTNMERMYFNMYLTMKHYEQLKCHPAFLPINFTTKESRTTNITEYEDTFHEDLKERFGSPLLTSRPIECFDRRVFGNEDIDINVRSEAVNIRDDFSNKSEDMDYQSCSESNDSSEETNEFKTNKTAITNHEDNLIERNNSRDLSCKYKRTSQSIANRHTDFSIERILSQDKCISNSLKINRSNQLDSDYNEFDWLKCTRYKPPKIHRLRKKEPPKKRTPGCNPRIPFSETTLKAMETKYQESPYITGDNLKEFAQTINVSKERKDKMSFWKH